jgi:hypothetical protein
MLARNQIDFKRRDKTFLLRKISHQMPDAKFRGIYQNPGKNDQPCTGDQFKTLK